MVQVHRENFENFNLIRYINHCGISGKLRLDKNIIKDLY